MLFLELGVLAKLYNLASKNTRANQESNTHQNLHPIVNKATILGRVGQDAELNNVGNDRSVVHFSVATSESKTDAEGTGKQPTILCSKIGGNQGQTKFQATKHPTDPFLYSFSTKGNIIKTTQWHRIVSWDQRRNPMLADRVKKGDLVYVEGPIQYRSYTAKDGSERHLSEISLSMFLILSTAQSSR